jgi:hypothetical protein
MLAFIIGSIQYWNPTIGYHWIYYLLHSWLSMGLPDCLEQVYSKPEIYSSLPIMFPFTTYSSILSVYCLLFCFTCLSFLPRERQLHPNLLVKRGREPSSINHSHFEGWFMFFCLFNICHFLLLTYCFNISVSFISVKQKRSKLVLFIWQ